MHFSTSINAMQRHPDKNETGNNVQPVVYFDEKKKNQWANAITGEYFGRQSIFRSPYWDHP